MPALTDCPSWTELHAHRGSLADAHLRDLFAAEPDRAGTMSFEVGDLYVDFSKQRASAETMVLLRQLAAERAVPAAFAAMTAGERLNTTEDRAVLHTALRRPRGDVLEIDGVDVVPTVHGVLDRMRHLADRVRSGAWTGSTGEPVRHVVNIGIGGSDLGPAMAARALRRDVADHLELHFVSNVDGDDLADALRAVDPASTLFVIASKTFTTLETMTNARSARDWLLAELGADTDLSRHFVAVSTNVSGVVDFGIDAEHCFEFWDWVGGRFSVCSAIGLSLMIGIGADAFGEFLDGFHTIDEHVVNAPVEANVPVLMALLGVWNRDFLDAGSHAVLPYSDALARFPAYLQQLEMESNGKRVTVTGAAVEAATCPVVWGEPGTNGQHAFYQLLHQGTSLVPCDFIGFGAATDPLLASTDHQRLLVSNMIAQAEALAFGRDGDEPHRHFPGNVPSTTILAPALTPSTLGQLIALYEHKVAAQGFLWGINSFDQWGVELGKQLATTIAAELEAGSDGQHDASTTELMRRWRELRDRR